MIYLPSQSNIITHVNAGKRPQTRDTQAFTQKVNPDKGNPVENWLSTVPLSPENLVDPLLQKTSEAMPSIAMGQISTEIAPSGYTSAGVRATNFRESLSYRNIYINHTDASSELVRRAKEIITTERSTREKIDDATAQELAVTARNLETGTAQDLIKQFGADLIPTMRKIPHRSLQSSANKL